jgi:hypothetical protein
VVASLLWTELADRRKDTESIAGQHNNVGRLAVNLTRDLCVGDEFNGISASSVFGDANVIIIRLSTEGVVDNILQDRAEANGIVDLGLFLSGEVDALGVATTFNVEDTLVWPDVLVVTYEHAVRVRWEGGLAGSRKAEEEGYIALLPANVGRRVKGQLAEFDGLKVML